MVLTFTSVPCVFVGFVLGLFLSALVVVAVTLTVSGRDE